MKIRLLSAFLFLFITACQRGGSAPAIRVTNPLTPIRMEEATPTINIITLVVPTRIPLQTTIRPESNPTVPPALTPSMDSSENRPLLTPRILKTDYTAQTTRLVVGFDIHPTQRGKPGISGEIFDATLRDQTGREIPGISIEMSQPDQVILEFAPLPLGVISLTLQAQLALHGLPAQSPLTIDVSRRPLDQAWPIQSQVHFGDLGVRLHTARLSRHEIGPPEDSKQQLRLELWGENVKLDGAQLLCLFLSPLPPQAEGGMSCGQEPDGISATVDLGPAVGHNAPLPMPTGLVILQASADFLLPGYWETTWPVKR